MVYGKGGRTLEESMKLSTSSYARWRVGTFVGIGVMALAITAASDWPTEAICGAGLAAMVVTALVLGANKDKEIF